MEAGVMVGARGMGVTMEVGADKLESAPSVGGILSISLFGVVERRKCFYVCCIVAGAVPSNVLMVEHSLMN